MLLKSNLTSMESVLWHLAHRPIFKHVFSSQAQLVLVYLSLAIHMLALALLGYVTRLESGCINSTGDMRFIKGKLQIHLDQHWKKPRIS